LVVDPVLKSIVRLGCPEASPKYHLQILHEPIVSIQHNDKKLLITTLSGFTFLANVHSPPPSSDTLYKAYMDHLKWAEDESNFNLNQFFQFEGTNPAVGKKETGMQGQWILFSKADDWRLMGGGSQGYVVIWNHRIGKYLYKLRVLSDTGNDQITIRKSEASKQDINSSGLTLNHRVGSLISFAKKDKSSSDTRAITSVAFDDSFVIAAGMNGSIFIWEPNA
jgi:hypothetical protein